MRYCYVYAIRKKIPIKKEPGMDAETVYEADFGEEMILIDSGADLCPEWIEVEYRCKKRANFKTVVYSGFIKRKWVSVNAVHDISKLKYQNKTEHTFGTSALYGGPRTGVIKPGEIVYVKAYCSPYALTNKGWVRADLICHEENATERCLIRVPADDYEGIVSLLKAMIEKAHSDFVEDDEMRDSIRSWSRSNQFGLFYGEYGRDFLKSCEKDAAESDERKRMAKRKTKAEIMRNAKKVQRKFSPRYDDE